MLYFSTAFLQLAHSIRYVQTSSAVRQQPEHLSKQFIIIFIEVFQVSAEADYSSSPIGYHDFSSPKSFPL